MMNLLYPLFFRTMFFPKYRQSFRGYLLKLSRKVKRFAWLFCCCFPVVRAGIDTMFLRLSVFFSVFRGSNAADFFELILKMTLGGKGKQIGNLCKGFVGKP